MEVFVKYRILKMAVVIGLVASSSLAVAEGKFAYKQPLRGVNASPTFGMTETEKQEYTENVEMCEEQYNGWENGYSRYSNSTYVNAQNQHYHTSYNLYINGNRVLRFSDPRTAPHGQKVTDLHREVLSERTDLYRVGDLKMSGSNGFQYWYYEITYLKKTENYDWCVDNGYQTAN